jgi:hypothetical protein
MMLLERLEEREQDSATRIKDIQTKLRAAVDQLHEIQWTAEREDPPAEDRVLAARNLRLQIRALNQLLSELRFFANFNICALSFTNSIKGRYMYWIRHPVTFPELKVPLPE